MDILDMDHDLHYPDEDEDQDEAPQINENGKRKSTSVPTPTPTTPTSTSRSRSRTDDAETHHGAKRLKTTTEENTADDLDDEFPDLPPVRTVTFRRVLKHIPQEIPYIPVTTEGGSRLYLRIIQDKKKKGRGVGQGFDAFGGDDDDDEEETRSRLLITTVDGSNKKLFPNWDVIKAQARILKDKFHRNLSNIVEQEGILDSVETPGENDENSMPGVGPGVSGAERKKEKERENRDVLWVEKYKPKSYLDLLSEEGVNKSLLHWLKLWDKSVFGRDYLAKVKITKEKYADLEAQEREQSDRFGKFGNFRKSFNSKDNNFPQRNYNQTQNQGQGQWKSQNQSGGFGGGGGLSGGLPEEESYDDMGRPKFKVALLHGPPGLGKTTCAHIVARHAGYNVREMNASDDRSVEIFRKTLDDVTQSKSETFGNGRPNCLVIDEIDGAPAPAVKVLIDLITGQAVESGKKKLKKVLKRPIICICNDLYAPSLKELRRLGLAVVLHFSPLTVPSLAERLHEISSCEDLNLDNGTITALCEKSECDIRSCLSTLQFLKRKKCSAKDLIFSQIGMKDRAKGLFPVWQEIFTIPQGKKHGETEDPSKPEARFRSVMRTVQSFGEYEKLLDGVFHNYLTVKFKDCYFESIIEGLSWASWFEDIQMSVDRGQNYTLMGYLPVYFVVTHFLYAQRGWVKINFPNNETALKIPRIRSVIGSLLGEVSPAIGRFLDGFSMVTDLFPALISIMQPSTIRPVPTQIWSARERETLRNVVEIMIAYNLSYSQIKNQDTGAYNFHLEPNIEEIAKFKLQDCSGVKRAFPYAVKQLVAREIETEKLRRSDSQFQSDSQDIGAGNSTSGPQKEKDKTPPKPKPGFSGFKIPAPAPVKKVVVDPSAAVAKDFFGRTVAPSAQNTQDLLAQQRRSSGIYFRFKEGYSNAVRRFIKMKDLQ